MHVTELAELTRINEAIDDIGFHDLPVDAIRFSMEDRSITLDVRDRDDDANVYRNIVLSFHDVRDVRLQDHGLILIHEIYDYTLTVQEDRFDLSIVFLCGHSAPSLELTFTFSTLILDGWPWREDA